MKNHKTLLFACCFSLNILLSLASQAQTTTNCDGCTISSTYTNPTNDIYSFIGTNSSLLTGANTTFFNQGTVQQNGSGGLLMGGFSESVYFNNEPGATYQFASDSSIGNDYSPSTQTAVFTNQGLVWKSDGTNYSAISVSYDNQGGTVEVDSGGLVLNGGGTSSNGVFNIASGAVLDLTGGSGPTWAGEITGSGLGTVSLADGSITGSPSLVLDFPSNLFQWNGGALQGIITNSAIVTISGTNASTLTGANTTFVNHGTVQQIGSGGSVLGTYGANVYFFNESGATYQLASDSSIAFGQNFYGQGSQSVPFVNQGLVWKSGGTNTSGISVAFNNQGGTVEVDSGTLVLYGSGTSSNGVFNVASGAVLDLTGGSSGPKWAGELTGSGSGQVWLDAGTLFASPSLVLDFPPNLFQWNGGILQGNITNTGTLTVSGTNVSTLTGANTTFYNLGTVRQIGSGGTIMGTYGGNVYFSNAPGATYQFASDSSVAWGLNFYGQGPQSAPFVNQGLIWKSGGTNTSGISPSFSNLGGSIEVDSGVLALDGNYAQGGGGLTIGLGGPNTNQCGQLVVGGAASLSGPLTVVLANGFVPVVGRQIIILSCTSFGGVFTSTNVPPGITVSYLQNNSGLPEYVELVVTGALPGQFQPPYLSFVGDTINFSIGTASGHSYTVQQNTNLATGIWTPYTNIIGDGSIFQFGTPIIGFSQRLFRVSEQ
jgi:hypothetical protein